MAEKPRDRLKKHSRPPTPPTPGPTLWEPSLPPPPPHPRQEKLVLPTSTLCTPTACTSQGGRIPQKRKKRPFSGRKARGTSEPSARGCHRTSPLWARGPENARIVPCPTPDPLYPPPTHTRGHTQARGRICPRDAPTLPPVVASPAAEPPGPPVGPTGPGHQLPGAPSPSLMTRALPRARAGPLSAASVGPP